MKFIPENLSRVFIVEGIKQVPNTADVFGYGLFGRYVCPSYENMYINGYVEFYCYQWFVTDGMLFAGSCDNWEYL